MPKFKTDLATRIAIALEAGNLAWWEMDLPSGKVSYDDNKTRMLGFKKEDFQHFKDFVDLVHPDDQEKVMLAMGRHLSGDSEIYETEYRIKTKDDGYRWFYDRGRITYKEGERIKVAGIVENISARKNLEEELISLSLRDALTGLYSRLHFKEEVQRQQGGRRFPVSVVYIDIDDLREVNNTLGHDAGDMLLKRVAEVLRGVFRAEDSVARIGGDEFVVLLPETDDKNAGETVARIRDSLADNNAKYPGSTLSISIGCATANKGEELEETVRTADKLMFKEKHDRKKRIG